MCKYKVGIIKHRGNDLVDYVASCSCGTLRLISMQNRFSDIACEGCGNTKFYGMSSIDKRILTPYLEILEKDRKGFKIKRTNLSIIIDEFFNLSFKKNQVQVLKYDLVNKDIKLWKNGHPISITVGKYLIDNRDFQRFFYQVKDREILDMIKSEETSELFELAWSSFSNARTWGGEKKLYRGLVRILDERHLQILANAGFTNLQRFTNNRYYGKNRELNTEGTSPKEIFQLPKFAIKYIRENENIGTYEISQLRKALQKVDGNRFKELMEIVKDEGTIRDLCNVIEELVEIHDTYGYNNIKKLTLYLFREIRMTQGISSPRDGAVLLRDYIKMSKRLGQEFEKYPKSLKKEHDITAMNYKVKEDSLKQKNFELEVSSDNYKGLEYKTKEYSVISPKEMDDLIKEGNELSHCVASYVNSVIEGKCKIYFMRKTDNLEHPFATIEVRGDNIRQCRGYANRRLSDKEREFVKMWARKKELSENYYY